MTSNENAYTQIQRNVEKAQTGAQDTLTAHGEIATKIQEKWDLLHKFDNTLDVLVGIAEKLVAKNVEITEAVTTLGHKESGPLTQTSTAVRSAGLKQSSSPAARDMEKGVSLAILARAEYLEKLAQEAQPLGEVNTHLNFAVDNLNTLFEANRAQEESSSRGIADGAQMVVDGAARYLADTKES